MRAVLETKPVRLSLLFFTSLHHLTDSPFLRSSCVLQTSAKELYSHINAHKILRHVSEVPSEQDSAATATAELELSTKLMELHRLGLEFGQFCPCFHSRIQRFIELTLRLSYVAGKDLVKTELQPSDDLVILAVNALISAWDATRTYIHPPITLINPC